MNRGPQTNISLEKTLREWWAESIRQRGAATTIGKFLGELWGFLRDSTPEQRRRRYGDVAYDWDHRVDTTSATVAWRSRLLGVFHSAYQPTEPGLFHEMLASLGIDFVGYTFIDLGSGKGRTLLMASEYPFRRIVGVELLPELHRVAAENAKKYASETQHCFQLEPVCGDAREFHFPEEPTVLYLFNPLPEPGLASVIGHLEQSLRHDPRPVFVLYHNPLLEGVLLASPALQKMGGTHQYSVFRSR
jgi:SAM-dependent methyltransferase